MDSINLTGRELKGIFDIFKSNNYSGQILISDGSIWVLDGKFSAKITYYSNSMVDDGQGHYVESYSTWFDGWDDVSPSILSADKLKVSDSIVINSDGTWLLNGVPSSDSPNIVDEAAMNRLESVKRLLDEKEPAATDGFYLFPHVIRKISKFIDSFKITNPVEFETIPFSKPGAYMLRGNVSQDKVKVATKVVRGRIDIKFITAA